MLRIQMAALHGQQSALAATIQGGLEDRMKGSFLNATRGVAALAAFLLGLSLPAGTRAEDNRQALHFFPERERNHHIWLKIMAFADAPIVGADVRVMLDGPRGLLLAEAKAATNSHGVFPARVWLPSIPGIEAIRDGNAREFELRRERPLIRISISGGTINGNPFLGRLAADLALTDPAHQILVVNPVTTLVSRVLDKRPDLKVRRAEELVRRFLNLPENYSLGLALRESSGYASPYFSPSVFMTEARDAGGVDAFVHLLHQELASASGTHPFRPPKALTSSQSNAASIIQAGLVAGLLDYAGSEGVSGLAGWALSLTGLVASGTSDGDIALLTEALVNLQSSIDNLSTQIAQLTLIVQAKSTQAQYVTITTQALTLANQVNDEENRLVYLSQDCPPVAAGGPQPPPPAPGSFCATEPQAIFTALNAEPIYSAYTNVEGFVRDNGTLGLEGMLHLYSLWLGQSKQFFRPADSTKMQALYDYWDGVLTQAADLQVELLHQQGEQQAGGAHLIAFMGNPDATPPTTGTFQADQAANLKLTFPPVPANYVISTQDPNHAMWALVPWVGNPGGSPPTGYPVDWKQQPACAYYSVAPALIYGQYSYPLPFPTYYGLDNWQWAPTKAQWQAAVSLAPTNGSVQWGAWLTQQTQTTGDESPASPGFFNCSGNSWVSTPSGTYLNINLVTNSFPSVPYSSPGVWYGVRPLDAGEQYYWYN
jgi:hypothetical protein